MFDRSGERLSGAELMAKMRAKFLVAKRLWNELDASECPRLPAE